MNAKASHTRYRWLLLIVASILIGIVIVVGLSVAKAQRIQARISELIQSPMSYPPMVIEVRPGPGSEIDPSYWLGGAEVIVENDICVYLDVDNFPELQDEANFNTNLSVDGQQAFERLSTEVAGDRPLERIICWNRNLSSAHHVVDFHLVILSSQISYDYSWVFKLVE